MPTKNKFPVYASTRDTKNVLAKTAIFDFAVSYSGKHIFILQGQKYYFDPATNQVLVGWHGSIYPPTDMNGTPLV
jgi:hypothetical protein